VPRAAGLTGPGPFSFFMAIQEANKAAAGLPVVFSIAELGARLGLSRRTITGALSSGELEHYRVGSRALIPEPAAVAWLEARRIGRRPRLRVA
jgi:excisionase family DNA binding protein